MGKPIFFLLFFLNEGKPHKSVYGEIYYRMIIRSHQTNFYI